MSQYIIDYDSTDVANLFFQYSSIGDTLGLTALLEQLGRKYPNKRYQIYSRRPEFFINNPWVVSSKHVLDVDQPYFEIQPVYRGIWSQKITQRYCDQFQLPSSPELRALRPKIYLTDDEKQRAKQTMAQFDGHKKIAVCLYSSADVRNVRYDVVKPFLKRLQTSLNCKLLYLGEESIPSDCENIFDLTIRSGDLRYVFALISECDLYVGVDTGLSHAAAAVDVKQLMFYRNNGCTNNAYDNTFYIPSKIRCPEPCVGPLSYLHCLNHIRCLDNYDFEKYYELAKTLIY